MVEQPTKLTELTTQSDSDECASQASCKDAPVEGHIIDHIYDKHVYPFIDSINTQSNCRLRDQISFTVSFLRFTFLMIAVLKYPTYFPQVYVASFLVILVSKYVYFRYVKWHYFLFDHCYSVNACLTAFILFFPDNQFLFNAVFACANGPTIWAFIILSFGIVPHQTDRMHTVHMHIEPAIATWVLRQAEVTGYNTQLYDSALHTYLAGMTQYTIFATISFTLLFKVLYHRWTRKNYDTLYLYSVRSKGVLMDLLDYATDKNKPKLFMFLQYIIVSGLIGFGTCATSETYQVAQILAIFALSCWYGSGFYINSFSRKYDAYVQSLPKRSPRKQATITKDFKVPDEKPKVS